MEFFLFFAIVNLFFLTLHASHFFSKGDYDK